jgi:hypothetical protein
MSTATTPQPNRLTKQEILQRMDTLGEQAGKGKDTQVKALLSILEGAYNGELDMMPNKNGTEIDDATFMAERYVKGQAFNTIFDSKAANQRKLISCFRTTIKAGGKTVFGNGEPLATIDRIIMGERNQLRKDPVQRKKLDDAANGFMKICRTLIKADVMPSDNELKQLLYKTERDPLTAEEKLENARDALQSLIQGDKNGQRDNSQKVKDAAKLLTDRLVDIAKGKGKTTP